MRIVFFAIGILGGASGFAYPLFPNSQETSGSFCSESDPDFLEFRYIENIPYCERKVTASAKKKIFRRYGVPEVCWERYTIDHFYPLFLGGSNHSDNLWPEHKLLKKTRMNLEYSTFRLLQAGFINQQQALNIIATEKLTPSSLPEETSDPCDQLESI